MALIHKEGYKLLLGAGLLLALATSLAWHFWPGLPATLISAGSGSIFLLILQFFRNPPRRISNPDDSLIYAPADGKVVVIEEVEEPEYFQDKRLQISIFMSPLNVHVNRNPLGGEVRYVRHHPGKYLVAWHPKSSTENERTTVVIAQQGQEVLLRQIAGAMAKRIRNYLTEGQHVAQGSEMGFIKFGSRVDVFLPLGTQIEVGIGQKVKGNQTVIAKLKEGQA
ncbi:phosphatidylserine decarboxylase family protein [Phaeodactylibacter luteus]|uniref:Phosphatidylserine decarboxylase proenzyme n=1 Tax=Phaeodactylibacter luteus TaxID=1564516 RepID=A0A5C6RMA0_9BACT|nr:phosphatidylserine decarboxylase family protein [Phaeodactylibacter luteus]TXB63498.1 phosphatidylserine decarboxylase family protein [Phaeodactylibacter luteus]